MHLHLAILALERPHYEVQTPKGVIAIISIIDYNTGNINSVVNMLTRLGIKSALAQKPSDIAEAKGIILPGVGSFDVGMNNLNTSGLMEELNRQVLVEKKPVLGICLGMQLMCNSSEEGSAEGLGWIDAVVKRFPNKVEDQMVRIPHIGWNEVVPVGDNRLFNGYSDLPRFYFVHSYYVECNHTENALAVTKYHLNFASAINSDNIFGVQFHPEKSHKYGMKLLSNFVEYCLC